MSVKSKLPEIIRLFDAGNTPRQIAEAVGGTPGYIRELLNRSRRGCVKSKFDERVAEALKDKTATEEIVLRLLRGEPVRKISRDTGAKYGTVWSIGIRNGMRKKTLLKRERALQMARLWDGGESQRSIAAAFGITQMGVSQAIRRVKRLEAST